MKRRGVITPGVGGKAIGMIGALSQNGLLSAVFGPGVLQRPPNSDRARTDPSNRNDTQGAENSDTVEISDAGRSLGGGGRGASALRSVAAAKDPLSAANGAQGQAARSKLGGEKALAPEEEKQVKELKKRDSEVRRHEQAHKGAAGGLAGGAPKFEYETGPDGRRYAVGGEVSIDSEPVAGDPKATIQKMQKVRQAALAPGEPSSQDRAVAAQASAAERQARAELAKERKQSPQDGKSPSVDGAAPFKTPTAQSSDSARGGTENSPYQAITSVASLIDITA